MRKVCTLLVCLLAIFGLTSPAQADVIDLTSPGAAGIINSGIFIQGATLSGTGVFPAFVEIGGNQSPVEAYNTTENGVLDNGNSDTFNHEITVSQLPIFSIAGVEYYSFFLDVNEDNSADGGKYLSLDQLMVITSSTPNQSITDPNLLGTVRYDMDAGNAGNAVLLDFSIGTGSGKADMRFFVPTAAFGGALSTDFVYLYSAFGAAGVVAADSLSATNLQAGSHFAPAGNYGNSDGFEEWALGQSGRCTSPTDCPVPEVFQAPEPASLGLFGLALLAGAARLRRTRKTH
jgi:hypothetical protein